MEGPASEIKDGGEEERGSHFNTLGIVGTFPSTLPV